MNKFLKMSFLIMISLNLNSIFAYSQEDLDEAIFGPGFLAFSDLCFAPLSNSNLKKRYFKCTWLIGANLNNSNLENATLKGVVAKKANFRHTNLKGTDLSKGKFNKAYFFGVKNLENAKSVENANFDNATGFTNQDKAFLRLNGAKNIPPDLSEEEFNQEQLQVEEELKDPRLIVFLDKIIGFVFVDMWIKMGHGAIKPIKLLQKLLSKEQADEEREVFLD